MAKHNDASKKRAQAMAKATEPRTEDDILGAQLEQIEHGQKITMGEKEYILMPKKGRIFSRKFRKTIQPILEDLSSVTDLISTLTKTSELNFKELDKESYKAIANILVRIAGEEFDNLLDLVYWWSPEISKDRNILEGTEDIEGTASELDFIMALIVIGKFVYGPLVFTLQMKNLQDKLKGEEVTD